MRIAVVDGQTHVWIRQSWLGDAIGCNERGRQAIVRPDWSITSDSAGLGTAVHRGAEAALLGEPNPEQAVRAEFEQILGGRLKRTLKMTDAEMIEEAVRLYRSWVDNYLPLVEAEGGPVKVEWKFDVPWRAIEVFGQPVMVHLEGTADLVTKRRLWDWKTAGRRYNIRDKQQQAVQPTIYSAAAVAEGLLEYPTDFRYGVMLRGTDHVQTVDVHRTQRHEAWLERQLAPLIAQAIGIGVDEPWSTNDTGYLCNATWCPWWAICKGAHLNPNDLTSRSN